MCKLMLLFFCFLFGFTTAKPIINSQLRRLEVGNETSTFFEDQFNKTIECVRQQLATEGIPKLGIPLMDPLFFNKVVPLKVHHEYLRIKMELSRLVINNLLGFKTVSLNLSESLQMESLFHFDKITSKSQYSGNINVLGLYAAYGTGDLDVEITNVDIRATNQYQISPPLVDNFKIVVKVGAVEIKMTDLMNDEDISRVFSKFASTAVTALIKRLEEQITALLSPTIEDLTNSFIGHIPFLDFLAMITSLSCENSKLFIQ